MTPISSKSGGCAALLAERLCLSDRLLTRLRLRLAVLDACLFKTRRKGSLSARMRPSRHLPTLVENDFLRRNFAVRRSLIARHRCDHVSFDIDVGIISDVKNYLDDLPASKLKLWLVSGAHCVAAVIADT